MKMRRRGLGYSRRMYLRAAVRSLLGPALALMWAASTAAQTDPTLDPTLDPNSDGGSDMLWMVGIVMEVCSAISGAIAKQLLRYYGKRNEILDAATGKMVHAATLKRPASIESESSDPMMTPKKKARWAMIIGLFLEFAVGPLLDMSAYAFAPASLIAPLASVQLLVNIVMAPHTLGEKRLPGHVVSAVTIMIAIVGITIFGHHEEPEFTLQILEDLFARWVVVCYFVFFATWQLGHGLLVVVRRPRGDLLRGLSLGMMGGAFNGNMYCIKTLMELIKASGKQGFSAVWGGSPFPYIIVSGTAVFVLMNAIMVTKAHKEYDAMFMVSVYVGTTVLFGTVSSVIVLDEFANVERWKMGCFWGAWSVVVIGIYILFRTEMRKMIQAATAVRPADGGMFVEVEGGDLDGGGGEGGGEHQPLQPGPEAGGRLPPLLPPNQRNPNPPSANGMYDSLSGDFSAADKQMLANIGKAEGSVPAAPGLMPVAEESPDRGGDSSMNQSVNSSIHSPSPDKGSESPSDLVSPSEVRGGGIGSSPLAVPKQPSGLEPLPAIATPPRLPPVS